ncbi:hypothetical protein A2U01_0081599, partial [Trifolium medium]|nr:hypothetical protein [Trifolium medium]
ILQLDAIISQMAIALVIPTVSAFVLARLVRRLLQELDARPCELRGMTLNKDCLA